MLKKFLIILQFFLISCKGSIKLHYILKGNEKIIEIFKNLKDNSENYDLLIKILNLSNFKALLDKPKSKDLSKEMQPLGNLEQKELFQNSGFKDRINALDEYGLNLFHYAVLYSNEPEILYFLATLGADINSITSEGKNSLFLLLESKISNDYSFKDKISLKKFQYELKKEKLNFFLTSKDKTDLNFKYKDKTFEQYVKELYKISNKMKDLLEEVKIEFDFYSYVLKNIDPFKNLENSLYNRLNRNIQRKIIQSLTFNDLDYLKKFFKAFNKKRISEIYIEDQDILTLAIKLSSLEIFKFLAPYFNLRNSIYIENALNYFKKEIVEELIKEGIDCNSYNEEGFTPLMILASSCSDIKKEEIAIWKELVVILLQNGAQINKKCFYSKLLNWTPIYWTINFKKPELVEFLIDMGAEINIKKHDLRIKIGKNQYDFTDAPLEYAILIEDIEIIKLLLKRGASISILNSSLVLYSVNLNKDLCNLILSEIRGKLNFSKSKVAERGTLLYNTLMRLKNLPIIAKEHLQVLEKLIENLHEDTNYEPEEFPGKNCLFLAVSTRCADVVELLLKNGARASTKNSFFNLYYESIYSKNLEIVLLLLKYGISPRSSLGRKYDYILLRLAISVGNRDIVIALIDSKKLKFKKSDLILDVILKYGVLDLSEVYDKNLIDPKIDSIIIQLVTKVGGYDNLRFLLEKSYSPFTKSSSELTSLGLNDSNFFNFMEGKKFSVDKFYDYYKIEKDESALDIAMKKQDLKAFSIIMEFYKEENLSKDLKEFIENNYMFGKKTLLVNIEKEYYGIVKILLKYKEFQYLLPTINYIDEDNNSLLDYLLEDESNQDLVSLLKEKGAFSSREIKERIRVEQEENSLINNIIKGNESKVLEIIENDKLEVIKADDNNITPLTTCVIYNRVNILKIIIKSLKGINKLSSNIDRVDIENKTALSYAIDSRNYEIIKILLESGANINFKYCRKYSYIIDLVFDRTKEAQNIIDLLYKNRCKLNDSDIKFVFKEKEKINPYILKVFKDDIKNYGNLYSRSLTSLKKSNTIDKILIDKETLKIFKNMVKENSDRLLVELKKPFEGKNFSDSRDIVGYKPKFGEIRLINNTSSDRIFYFKKKNYLVIIDIYLDKRKRVLPIHVYSKAFEKCKLYKNIINKNKIEEFLKCVEVLIAKSDS